jgi:hypothetical protein
MEFLAAIFFSIIGFIIAVAIAGWILGLPKILVNVRTQTRLMALIAQKLDVDRSKLTTALRELPEYDYLKRESK